MIGTTGIGLLVAVPLMLLVGSASATPTQKCQEAKLKARGKLELCLNKNGAKVLGGKPDASAACKAKFQAALSKAEHIAIAAGTTACRYVANGDGTTSDLNTSLMWEQKAAGSNCTHCVNDVYKWSNSGTVPDGAAFTVFLGALNNGTSEDGNTVAGCFAGYCDWRLPTIAELQGIVRSGSCGASPCLDPAFGLSPPFLYWSATSLETDPTQAFFINTSFGNDAGADPKFFWYYVRAVRGENLVPPPTSTPTPTPVIPATATATATLTPSVTATATATFTP